jgi:hypothetical protein
MSERFDEECSSQLQMKYVAELTYVEEEEEETVVDVTVPKATRLL